MSPKNRFAFFEGEIVPIEEAKVSIMTHALNYGTGAFGGIRAYWNDKDEELYIFRVLEHFERLLASAKMMLMDLPYTKEDMASILLRLLQAEGYRSDTYIRPLIYKSDPIIGVKLNDLAGDFAMFAIPFGSYVDAEEGTRVAVSSWRRINDNSIPARGKFTGAYINSAFIKTEALLNGYDEALVIDESGHVSEGSAENVFIVRKDKLITPPVNADILEGITRRTIMHLVSEEMGLEVIERPIDRTEFYVADEAFFCGTGVQVAAIIEVDQRPVGNGKMGPMVEALRNLYFRVVRGQHPAYKHWSTPVYASQTAPTPATD
ncbi:MAG: branched-chain amino acid transaminase [Chloroflexi bacterium]|nr:branched-chain amino acid transaminase [Chloroflexota bacterium]